MKRRNLVAGFSWVEFIVVIVIAGLLAAVVIPFSVNRTTSARVAAMNAMGGALSSTVLLAKTEYKTKAPGTTFIDIHGQTLVVSGSGYPTGSAEGIGAELRAIAGFTATYGAVTQFDFTSPVADCNTTYTAATGQVIVTTKGC